MNIIVKTERGNIVTRPDTSWEKENRDLYLPDNLNKLSFTPIIFAKICKTGRCVKQKFAERYFDSFNYGILLFADDLNDGTDEGLAASSCLDKTSYLPFPMYNLPVMQNKENVFELRKNDKLIFSSNQANTVIISSLIEDASSKVNMRIGDIVCMELCKHIPLYERSEGNINISSTFCNNPSLDFNIIVE